MKRLFLSGLVLAGLLSAASAQNIGGVYTVEGTNHDGSPYRGEARITLTSDTTCEIEWATGGTSSHGICSRNGDSFAAAYVMGKSMGLVIYKLQPDGSLDGLWTVQGMNGTGTERLRRR